MNCFARIDLHASFERIWESHEARSSYFYFASEKRASIEYFIYSLRGFICILLRVFCWSARFGIVIGEGRLHEDRFESVPRSPVLRSFTRLSRGHKITIPHEKHILKMQRRSIADDIKISGNERRVVPLP